MSERTNNDVPAAVETGLEIAVIGIDGRFPGARNIDEFWENLKNGIESISFFSDEELGKNGVDSQVLKDTNYVKASAVLEDTELFDSSFFGYSPREAELMLPQSRIFHECVWTALEDAGYDPTTYDGVIGLYGGSTSSVMWEVFSFTSGKRSILGDFSTQLLTDKDQLCTRISYNLNLRGPAFTLNTACSTSLVTLHLACQGLLSGECDIALTGGISLFNGPRQGYVYQEGGIYSSDGHCRAFDVDADGTVAGEGVGVVVLKPLEEATADRDNIYAVIKGTAINNDGSSKVGYTAPSVKGQVTVICNALQAAQVEPETVGYVETHGTGTPIGDPIEIEALKLAFNTKKKQFCRIGSVKSNVGHLVTAAGIAGFIKTILILKHHLIPPTLHFKIPNSKIDFENSPFVVNDDLSRWKQDKHPLRACVSAFGIGGTNAHVVLEEAPKIPENIRFSPSRKYKMILLSAKTQPALDKMTENLAKYLKENPDINLANLAYTLQVGRGEFNFRRRLVSSSVSETIDILLSPDSRKIRTIKLEGEDYPVVFMFSGLGGQYVNMGFELYQKEPGFRCHLDQCFDILKATVDWNIKQVLYPAETSIDGESVNQFEVAQLLIFIFEYALARLLMEWGIKPQAMIGYSFGEYVAACIAGVFSLEDAIKLVVARGKLIRQTPTGAMLSVPLSKEKVVPLFNNQLSLAIDNDISCIVAGSTAAVNAIEEQLKETKQMCMPLQTTHAIHSVLMDTILEEFEKVVGQIKLNKPQIPYISNVTGKQMTGEDAVDPHYWAKHLRGTVRFAEGIKELLKESSAVLVEIGPGRDLSSLVSRYLEDEAKGRVINTVRQPEQDVSDVYYLLNKVGNLWLYGQTIDWQTFYANEKRYRLALPTYPFQRQQFEKIGDIPGSITNDAAKGGKEKSNRSMIERKPNMEEWFYIPTWKQSPLTLREADELPASRNWVVLVDGQGFSSRLAQRLRQENQNVFVVKPGETFKKINDHEYIINMCQSSDYDQLFTTLLQMKKNPNKILHLWSLAENDIELKLEDYDRIQDSGFYCLLNIVQAIGRLGIVEAIELEVVTNNMHEVTGEETFLYPLKGTMLGAVKIIPLEYLNIKCRSLDVIIPEPGSWQEERLLNQLLAEFKAGVSENVVAFRGNYRWKQFMDQVRLDKVGERTPRLKEGGVYLIIGGFGGMGFTFAQYLGKTYKARLILVGRTVPPPRQEWEQWLKEHDDDDDIAQKIGKIKEIEEQGAEVMIFSADVADKEQMEEVISKAEERFGQVNGVIHTAGVIDFSGIIQNRSREMTETSFAPKVKGPLVIDHIFRNRRLDFFTLFSSLGTTLYKAKFGEVGYNAGNNFLDLFAYYKRLTSDTFTVTINWTDWLEVGMSLKASIHMATKIGKEFDFQAFQSQAYSPVSPAEGIEVFNRILESRFPRVGIGTNDLPAVVEYLEKFGLQRRLREVAKTKYQRPDLSTEYVPPGNLFEENVAEMWEELFGIEKVGIHDDFFELGGDSVLAMNCVNKLNQLMGEIIHITVMFEATTIAKLFQYFKDHYPQGVNRLLGNESEAGEKTPVKENFDDRINRDHVARLRDLIPSLPLPEDAGIPRNAPVIFILCAPRTGSTLLRVMLGGHPRLFAPPELDLLSYTTLEERRNAIGGRGGSIDQGPIRAIMQIKNRSAEKAALIMKEFEEQRMSTQEFYRVIQTWLGDKILVDKSPGYAVSQDILKRAELYFQDALYIHLLRHPYAMIRSYEEAKLDLLSGGELLSKLSLSRRQFAELIWVIDNQNIMAFLEGVPKNRWQRVKFEDLVHQPQQVVEGICKCLGIEFHPGMLQPYEEKKKRMTDGVHETGIMIGDVKFHQHKKIEPIVADAWKEHYTVDFLGDVTAELAEHFGYLPKIGEVEVPTNLDNEVSRTERGSAQQLLNRLDQASDQEVDALLQNMLLEERRNINE